MRTATLLIRNGHVQRRTVQDGHRIFQVRISSGVKKGLRKVPSSRKGKATLGSLALNMSVISTTTTEKLRKYVVWLELITRQMLTHFSYFCGATSLSLNRLWSVEFISV